eukprot:gene6860-1728_t
MAGTGVGSVLPALPSLSGHAGGSWVRPPCATRMPRARGAEPCPAEGWLHAGSAGYWFFAAEWAHVEQGTGCIGSVDAPCGQGPHEVARWEAGDPATEQWAPVADATLVPVDYSYDHHSNGTATESEPAFWATESDATGASRTLSYSYVGEHAPQWDAPGGAAAAGAPPRRYPGRSASSGSRRGGGAAAGPAGPAQLGAPLDWAAVRSPSAQRGLRFRAAASGAAPDLRHCSYAVRRCAWDVSAPQHWGPSEAAA